MNSVIEKNTICKAKSKLKERRDTSCLVNVNTREMIAQKVGNEAMLGVNLVIPAESEVVVLDHKKVSNVNTVFFKEVTGDTVYSTFYLVFKQMFNIPKESIIKKPKDLSSKIAKMPNKGIYVEIYKDEHGNKYFENAPSGGSIYYIDGKGRALYIRGSSDWSTIQWNCAPTRKKIAKGYKYIYKSNEGYDSIFKHFPSNSTVVKTTWEYYPSWKDFKTNCALDVYKTALKFNPELM